MRLTIPSAVTAFPSIASGHARRLRVVAAVPPRLGSCMGGTAAAPAVQLLLAAGCASSQHQGLGAWNLTSDYAVLGLTDVTASARSRSGAVNHLTILLFVRGHYDFGRPISGSLRGRSSSDRGCARMCLSGRGDDRRGHRGRGAFERVLELPAWSLRRIAAKARRDRTVKTPNSDL